MAINDDGQDRSQISAIIGGGTAQTPTSADAGLARRFAQRVSQKSVYFAMGTVQSKETAKEQSCFGGFNSYSIHWILSM